MVSGANAYISSKSVKRSRPCLTNRGLMWLHLPKAMSSNAGGGCEFRKGEGLKQQWQPYVRKSPYRGDVSALCLISSPQRHLVLAGTGAQVLLYDLVTGGLLCCRNVFDGVRVHGIYSGPAIGKGMDAPTSQVAFRMGTIVIHGERKIKLFKMVWHLAEETPQLCSLGSLPRFSYWVMDVRILQEEETTSESALAADTKDFHLLAVGLSNNTICIWDLLNSTIIYRVECSERCLLYSMRLWGDSLETLHAGAGTVFNVVLVMKLGYNLSAVREMSAVLTDLRNSDNSNEDQRRESVAQDAVVDSSPEFAALEEEVHPLQRLIGHEGSIHRLTWSTDGLSLVSVSDDRSARVWCAKKSATGGDPWLEEVVPGPVLYGHGSRLWDCYVGEKLLITASEDCTCRLWTEEGNILATLKGHIGRGVWRCVYDPEVNILVTAGADSSIKVQSLDNWVPKARSCAIDQQIDPSVHKLELQSFSVSPPWLNGSSEGPLGFMDSKSEYVRCVALSSPWSLYISTNQGAVFHVHLQRSKEASWTLLLDDLEGPIVCMDVIVQGLLRDSSSGGDDSSSADVVAVGNGRGTVCLMQVRRTAEQWHCEWRHSWVAEKERQLLGVYFCKSLGQRYVFTTDPRGTWRMWHVSDRKDVHAQSIENPSAVTSCTEKYTADLMAYGRGSQARVLCINVCPDLELLVCGDKRGDLTIFALPKQLCRWVSNDVKLAMSTEIEAPTQLPVVAIFKGAHGISAIASVSIMPFNPGRQPEIISTGSDGYICRFLLDQHWTAAVPQTSQYVLCTGIEKVAELSIVECLRYCEGVSAQKRVDRRIAAGFTGSDFLLWDLSHQCEVMRVVCGGWRRPHSVFVGDFPEMQYCFVFIKDKMVQVQRNWVNPTEGENCSVSGSSLSNTAPKMTTQSLRGQFHGKEISSVLILHSTDQASAHEGSNPVTWIATGSEDGMVVISRYAEDAGEQLDPTAVLGDHVGGSAVRALALVAEVGLVRSGEFLETSAYSAECKAPPCGDGAGRVRDQQLLFSAGAKEVLTCWLLDWLPEVEGEELSLDHCQRVEKLSTSLVQNLAFPRHRAPSSQWLSTHSPERVHPFVEKMATGEKDTESVAETDEEETPRVDEKIPEHRKQESYTGRPEDADDDQRYLALTAFGRRCTNTRTLISFIATASSNATLHLYAFHLAHRSWSELAVLENDTALVLTVEHLVAPFSSYSSGDRDAYIIITGAANGNIALWDVTNLVNEYCSADEHDVSRPLVTPLRPLTGRGSQGGRRRKKTAEYSRESVSLKYSDGKSVGTEKALNSDPVGPAFVSGGENEEDAGSDYIQASPMLEEIRLPESPRVQPSQEPAVMKPPLRLNPVQEVIAAHQSGINCMAVGRINRAKNSASSKIVYVVISGGDDQALHMATFALELNNSNDLGGAQRGKLESSFESMPLVLRCLSRSSVPYAHNSSVKGLWTDGFWAFSTGLDQRLRCWRVNADVASSDLPDSCEVDDSRHPNTSPLVECLTCVIDVPEPACLHVKHFVGGLYQIAVVGRGLQMRPLEISRSVAFHRKKGLLTKLETYFCLYVRGRATQKELIRSIGILTAHKVDPVFFQEANRNSRMVTTPWARISKASLARRLGSLADSSMFLNNDVMASLRRNAHTLAAPGWNLAERRQ